MIKRHLVPAILIAIGLTWANAFAAPAPRPETMKVNGKEQTIYRTVDGKVRSAPDSSFRDLRTGKFISKGSNHDVYSHPWTKKFDRPVLNTATARQIAKATGISLSLAKRIVAVRDKMPRKWMSADDLKKVPGVGQKSLAAIMRYTQVVVVPPAAPIK